MWSPSKIAARSDWEEQRANLPILDSGMQTGKRRLPSGSVPNSAF